MADAPFDTDTETVCGRPVAKGKAYHFNVIYNYARCPLSSTADTQLSLAWTRRAVEELRQQGLVNSYFYDRDCRRGQAMVQELARVIAGSEVTVLLLSPGFVRDCWPRYWLLSSFRSLFDASHTSSSPSSPSIPIARFPSSLQASNSSSSSPSSPRTGSLSSPRTGSLSSPRTGSLSSPRTGSLSSPRQSGWSSVGTNESSDTVVLPVALGLDKADLPVVLKDRDVLFFPKDWQQNEEMWAQLATSLCAVSTGAKLPIITDTVSRQRVSLSPRPQFPPTSSDSAGNNDISSHNNNNSTTDSYTTSKGASPGVGNGASNTTNSRPSADSVPPASGQGRTTDKLEPYGLAIDVSGHSFIKIASPRKDKNEDYDRRWRKEQTKVSTTRVVNNDNVESAVLERLCHAGMRRDSLQEDSFTRVSVQGNAVCIDTISATNQTRRQMLASDDTAENSLRDVHAADHRASKGQIKPPSWVKGKASERKSKDVLSPDWVQRPGKGQHLAMSSEIEVYSGQPKTPDDGDHSLAPGISRNMPNAIPMPAQHDKGSKAISKRSGRRDELRGNVFEIGERSVDNGKVSYINDMNSSTSYSFLPRSARHTEMPTRSSDISTTDYRHCSHPSSERKSSTFNKININGRNTKQTGSKIPIRAEDMLARNISGSQRCVHTYHNASSDTMLYQKQEQHLESVEYSTIVPNSLKKEETELPHKDHFVTSIADDISWSELSASWVPSDSGTPSPPHDLSVVSHDSGFLSSSQEFSEDTSSWLIVSKGKTQQKEASDRDGFTTVAPEHQSSMSLNVDLPDQNCVPQSETSQWNTVASGVGILASVKDDTIDGIRLVGNTDLCSSNSGSVLDSSLSLSSSMTSHTSELVGVPSRIQGQSQHHQQQQQQEGPDEMGGQRCDSDSGAMSRHSSTVQRARQAAKTRRRRSVLGRLSRSSSRQSETDLTVITARKDSWIYQDLDKDWTFLQLLLPLYRIVCYAFSRPDLPYF